MNDTVRVCVYPRMTKNEETLKVRTTLPYGIQLQVEGATVPLVVVKPRKDRGRYSFVGESRGRYEDE